MSVEFYLVAYLESSSVICFPPLFSCVTNHHLESLGCALLVLVGFCASYEALTIFGN